MLDWYPPTGTRVGLCVRISPDTGGDVGLDDGRSTSIGVARSIWREYRRLAGMGCVVRVFGGRGELLGAALVGTEMEMGSRAAKES